MLRFRRDLFLQCICIMYAVAFASLQPQIRGLYGEDGLEPVDVFLQQTKQSRGLHDASPLLRIAAYPTLVWLHEPLQWTPSFCMEVLCLVGTTLAVLGAVQPAFRTTAPLALLWVCYLSIVQCGQTFLQFQWDSLLLETGALSILLAPWWRFEEDTFETSSAAVWTLRFLFFKFMLMSGAVKIQSGCPTWLGLSALDFHYATQPLPLPLAWYAIQAPPIINRLAVAVTLLIEGPWTFFLLAPHPTLRKIGAVQQIVLQISIMMTGNYNFFNLLTVIFAVALIDTDRSTVYFNNAAWTSRVESAWHTFQTHAVLSKVFLLGSVWFCVYSWLEVFEMTLEGEPLSFQQLLLGTRVQFVPSIDDTQAWLARILPRCGLFSLCLVVCSGCWQMTRCIAEGGRSRKYQVLRLLYLLTTTLASIWVFMGSSVTLSVLDQSFQKVLPSSAIAAYHTAAKFRITSAYGLFRTMTGVGVVQFENGERVSVVARPEIILEGTKDGGATWEAYNFKFKPGEVDSAPRLIAPFHPRLDWQMWFAALGDYHSAPWLVHLIAKLLEGSPDVTELLDTARNPFAEDAPDAIRAQLYYYDFTRLNTSWNREIPTAKILDDNNNKQWWTRTFVREYIPSLERGNPSLKQFVLHHWPRGVVASETNLTTNSVLRGMLEWLIRTPLAPVDLASGIIVAKLVGAATTRRWRSLQGAKMKMQ